MATAAFFDLDGTLLLENSATIWVRRQRRLGKMHPLQLVRVAIAIAGYRLGLLDIERALGAALAELRGTSEASVREETREWWQDEVRPHIAPGARAVLARHRAQGDLLVLLTSSSRYAAEMAREEFQLDAVLFQDYEVRDGRFTGQPVRPLCYGSGKVETAEAWARGAGVDLATSSFYSDSSTDVPMLEKVRHPFVVNPDPRLRWIARRRKWPLLDWRQAGGA